MTDTPKKRVSTLAKDHEVTSDVLLRLLNEAGVGAKTSSSTIDPAEFQKVKPFLQAEKQKQEREELVKAGKKIPMKAVIKKAPPAPIPAIVTKKAVLTRPEAVAENATVATAAPAVKAAPSAPSPAR
jgi:hypothetical protein